VHCLFHPSTWTPTDYCYLQDLFVDASSRRGGVGRALIATVVDFARDRGANRVIWLTNEDNVAARSLYDAVARRTGLVQYRIDPH
ncbi:MAG: GNAT family N-acetyltransferase, partial [Proteobacteria bacterium]|nr:GNAT family N-acetyltransferase [Pseudomonadota bacterium]